MVNIIQLPLVMDQEKITERPLMGDIFVWTNHAWTYGYLPVFCDKSRLELVILEQKI